MADFTQFLIDAAALSALYALVAIGFTLVFGVGDVLNLAHGGFVTTGAFAAYVVSSDAYLGLDPWLGLAVAVAVGAVLGAVAYRGVVQQIRDRPAVVLVVTIVGGLALEHLFRISVTDRPISVPEPVPGQTEAAGLAVPNHAVLVFVGSWLLVAALLVFLNYTEPGRALLATSTSERGAALVGIDADFVNLYTWAIAAALATVSGALLAGFQSGSWNMGLEPLVLSVAIVVLGGLGSIRGSIVGAYVVGFLETATTTFIDSRLAGLTALVLLVVVLLVRPSGLFGREVAA